MEQAVVVDESDLLLLSFYELCLYAVRYVSEASSSGPRGVGWGLVRRLGCEINGAVALGDLCGGLLRVLADETVDVAVGERLCTASGGQHACVECNARLVTCRTD